MATRKLTPEQLASINALARQWRKIVARNACGDDGPGLDVDFDQMEQLAAAATAGLAAGTREHLAEQQAQRLPDQLPAPPASDPVRSSVGPGSWSHAGPRPPCEIRSPTAPPAAGTFSPQRTHLRLDSHGYSPSVLAKVVHAGAALPSFESAAETLRLRADVSISGRHVGRLAELVGAEMVARRDEQAEQHHARKLAPRVPNAPAVVAVEVDGGRYQRRAEGQGCGARPPSGVRTRWPAWSRSGAAPTRPTRSPSRRPASSIASTFCG